MTGLGQGTTKIAITAFDTKFTFVVRLRIC
jgi:hypothetical protein